MKPNSKPTVKQPKLLAPSYFADTISINRTHGVMVPPQLADDALCCIKGVAAALGSSVSQAYEMLHEAGAPEPVVRRPRFVRYRIGDVRTWLISLAKGQAAANDEAGPATVTRAKAASDAAMVKRCEGCTP